MVLTMDLRMGFKNFNNQQWGFRWFNMILCGSTEVFLKLGMPGMPRHVA